MAEKIVRDICATFNERTVKGFLKSEGKVEFVAANSKFTIPGDAKASALLTIRAWIWLCDMYVVCLSLHLAGVMISCSTASSCALGAATFLKILNLFGTVLTQLFCYLMFDGNLKICYTIRLLYKVYCVLMIHGNSCTVVTSIMREKD